MSEVKRYHTAYVGSMFESQGNEFYDGVDFVDNSDYAALEASHAKLADSLRELCIWVEKNIEDWDHPTFILERSDKALANAEKLTK